METLRIEGIIGRKGDPSIGPKDQSFSFSDLESFLNTYGGGPFRAVFKSPGGSVEEGFKIYNELKKHEVHTEAIIANSIASVAFMAGKTRKVYPDTEMIIHNAWVDAEVLVGEKLNFHTLSALTEAFAATDMQILSIYSSVAGDEKASQILALMAQETNVDANRALALGFATEILDVEAVASSFKNRVLTYCKNQTDLIEDYQKTQLDMNDKEKISGFEKALAGLKNLFKGAFKNMAVTAKDGTALFISGPEEGELVGKPVFTAVEGLPTEEKAPAGSYELEDGKTITIDEAGLISEVVEPAPAAPVEDVVALQAAFDAKEEEMKAAHGVEVNALKAEIVNLKQSNSTASESLKALVKDFADLKNEVLGDPDKRAAAPVVLSKEEFRKLTPGEKIRLQAMNKAESKK